MRFLDPKTDYAFKKIFGSEDSKDILLSFLNAILDLNIESVEILDPYLAPKIKGMKDTFLDVKAVNNRGEVFVIEMQVLNVEGFEKRVLYNAAKAYSNQIAKAEHYRQLKPIIALTITDFLMFPENDEVTNFFKLREKTSGFELTGDLEFVFVELPKFDETEDELDSLFDKWLYFLKNAGDISAVPTKLSSEKAIDHAFQIANKANLSLEELEAQEKREMFIGDQKNWIIKAQKKGLAEGIEQGIKKGLEQGIEQGLEQGIEQGLEQGIEQGIEQGREVGAQLQKREIAQKMFAAGLDLAQIQVMTGLTEKELLEIKK